MGFGRILMFMCPFGPLDTSILPLTQQADLLVDTVLMDLGLGCC